MEETEAARLHACILRAVRSVCPPGLAGEAEDLAQAATLKVLERLAQGSLHLDGLAASYLWRTAHSVVIDEIRRRVRRPSVPLAEHDPPGPNSRFPEESLSLRRLGQAMQECLQRSSPPRRRAVALHLVGHSVQEIATRCAWRVKRAENLVYRGLADLRACLRAKGYRRES